LPYQDARSILAKRFDLAGKRVILSVGHLHAMRNRKDLILAMPHVIREIPNTILLIAGDISTQLPGDLVKKLGIEKSVIFAGGLQHVEISALLEMADLEVHWLDQDKPSRTSLGIASLEAMSAGVTILAAVNPETYGKGVLMNGENIVIVEPNRPRELAETIVNLLREDNRRKAIGARARQTILDHFSWDNVGAQTIQVYESVMNNT
jgi:phosphatidylinositol alpha-1,6-mannosyltransferase